MDKKISIHDVLFNTPLWRVFDYLLQHPEMEMRDTEISLMVRTVKKSAINIALRRLADLGFITRYHRGRQAFNKLNESPLITHLKVISNIIAVKELTDKLIPLCSRVILFGSRAEGAHTSESDFDIFVVTQEKDKVNKLIRKSMLEDRIQLVSKSPEEMLTFDKDEPALRQEIKKGIIIWERD